MAKKSLKTRLTKKIKSEPFIPGAGIKKNPKSKYACGGKVKKNS
jgi:hypothetical protein